MPISRSLFDYLPRVILLSRKHDYDKWWFLVRTNKIRCDKDKTLINGIVLRIGPSEFIPTEYDVGDSFNNTFLHRDFDIEMFENMEEVLEKHFVLLI